MAKKPYQKVTLVSPKGGEYTPANKQEETRLRAQGYKTKKKDPAPAAPKAKQTGASKK